MKISNKSWIVLLFSVPFVLSLAGLTPAFAATSPSLGAADTYGVLAGTYTNTTATTVIGDVGYTTGPATPPTVVGGTIYGAGAPTPQARIDAAAALNILATEPCTENLGIIVNLSTVGTHPTGVYNPGVYCSTGAMSIGTGGITLSGAGTYIFRAAGALTSVDNSVVTLADGASSCNVFWTPTAATTLGANTTFIGTIIDNANAVTIGHLTSLTGRALSLGAGVVTTDTNVINRTCVTVAAIPSVPSANNILTVIKQVINANGGTAVYSDFPLFMNGNPVISGQGVSAVPGIYQITETSRAGYTATFSGDCNASGQVNHGGVNTHNNICILTNSDISLAAVPAPPLIHVTKIPNFLSLAAPGSVTYSYAVSNVGIVPMTNIAVTDNKCSAVGYLSGDTNLDSKLDIGEIWNYSCAITLSQTTTNQVTATGRANGFTATDIAVSTVVVGSSLVPPLIDLVKIPSPLFLPAGGGSVNYTYLATNPGVVPLANVTLTDNRCSQITAPTGDANSNSLLDPSETWTYYCSVNLTASTTNTGIATGSANGFTVTHSSTVTVAVASPGLPNTGTDSKAGKATLAAMGILVVIASLLSLVFIKRTD